MAGKIDLIITKSISRFARNTVDSLTTVRKLKEKGITHVISALDNDECGRKGARYLKQFFNVTPFQFPEGIKDPGELNQTTFNEAYNKTKIKFKKEKHNGISR